MAHSRRRLFAPEVAIPLLAVAVLAPLDLACKSRDKAAASTQTSSAPASAASSAPASSVSPSASASGVTDAGRAADAGPDFEAGECADFEPSRWAPYKGYDDKYACWLFRPAARDRMPRPLAWEPCEREEFGPRCRRIQLAPRERLYFDSFDARDMHAPKGGPVRIQTIRSCDGVKSRIYSITQLDGPTLAAYADDSNFACEVRPTMTVDGWTAQVRVNIALEPAGDFENPFASEELARLLGSATSLEPKKLEDRAKIAFIGPPAGFSRFEKRNKELAIAMRIPDGVRTASAFTDGTDIVWSFPESKAKDAPCVVARAPYTEDVATLVPTRVLGARCKDVADLWIVGCEYAATRTRESQALLLRLKDGMTFRFPKLCGPLDDSSACQTRPLAITCKDVFLAVGGKKPNIFRIPLDALPKGTEPSEPPKPFDPLPDAGAPAASAAPSP